MRTISTINTTIVTESVEPQPAELRAWLEEQAAKHAELGLRWLLAHCYDGVIWGELRDGKLALSCDEFVERGLTLRWTTLQQARLFGELGELLLWPGPRGSWRATLRHDRSGDATHYIDETHLLWGTRAAGKPKNGFWQIVEGVQGIVHAPPISVVPTAELKCEARARLKVRHYLGEEETGLLYIAGGRLVRLVAPGEITMSGQQ